MSNLSDGTSDGLALFYVKDQIIYPVALTKDQLWGLDLTLGITLGNVSVVFDKPIGTAINLVKERAHE